MQSSISALLLTFSSVSAASYGFYSVSLCPFDASALANYTNNSFQTTGATWAGKPLSAVQACPVPLKPAAQRITVSNSFFKMAQTNFDRWWLEGRSHTYALSIFRPSFVPSAYLDLDIVDATGTTIVPRMQVSLRGPGNPSSELTTLRTRRSKPKGKQRHTKAKQGNADRDGMFTSEEQATRLPPKKLHLGRRKGKGGGIGGGGRYGGGNGGFRSASSTKSYGYSSSALKSRFAPGYTRTPYGYSGRSVILVGTSMHLYHSGWGTTHQNSAWYRQHCERYSGDDKLRCHASYNGTITASGAQEYKSRSTLLRDDLMGATVNTKHNITLPLTVTIHKAAVMFAQGAPPELWDPALLFSFSEVDFDEENDPIMPWWLFGVLVGLGCLIVVPLCCLVCCATCCALFDGPEAQVCTEQSVDLEANTQTWGEKCRYAY